MEILVATHNQHKKEEIQQILPDYNITSLTDYDLFEEIIEDGDSFEANAKIKAKYGSVPKLVFKQKCFVV